MRSHLIDYFDAQLRDSDALPPLIGAFTTGYRSTGRETVALECCPIGHNNWRKPLMRKLLATAIVAVFAATTGLAAQAADSKGDAMKATPATPASPAKGDAAKATPATPATPSSASAKSDTKAMADSGTKKTKSKSKTKKSKSNASTSTK